MKRIFSFCIALLGAAATSAAAAYGIDGNNVTISLGSKGMVRLQVINANIIRVEATPEGRLPQKQSLIIVPQQEYKKFKVEEDGNAVIVSTDSIAAKVSKSDGQVVFVDHKGRIILSETKGGRTFTKYRVPDREIGRNNPDDNPATLLTEEQRTKMVVAAKVRQPRIGNLPRLRTASGGGIQLQRQERGAVSIQHESERAFRDEQPRICPALGQLFLGTLGKPVAIYATLSGI